LSERAEVILYSILIIAIATPTPTIIWCGWCVIMKFVMEIKFA